jgi:hypothetical protein
LNDGSVQLNHFIAGGCRFNPGARPLSTHGMAHLVAQGEIQMTLPTVIYFGPDGGSKADAPPEKVFLRTLLYSTGKRGHIIENMSCVCIAEKRGKISMFGHTVTRI